VHRVIGDVFQRCPYSGIKFVTNIFTEHLPASFRFKITIVDFCCYEKYTAKYYPLYSKILP
jgi:hypothetical protein